MVGDTLIFVPNSSSSLITALPGKRVVCETYAHGRVKVGEPSAPDAPSLTSLKYLFLMVSLAC